MSKEIMVTGNSDDSKENQKIKQLLNVWAESKSNKIKDFGNQIEILDIAERNAIRLDFRTRYVQREFDEDRIMPYTGQQIPKETSELNDIWTYKTENSNANNKDDEEITLQNFKNMEQKYEELYGDNLGILNTFNEFFGDVEEDEKDENPTNNDVENLRTKFFKENASCYPFSQTYRLDICPTCVGKGKVICWRCNGSGRILENGKRIYCSKCQGAKNVICDDCLGKKKVVYHTSLLEHFTYKDESKFFLPDDLDKHFKSDIEQIEEYEQFSENEIVITQDNASVILKQFEEDKKNNPYKAAIWKILSENIKLFMSEKSMNLKNENVRINQYTIKQFILKFKIIKYKFNDNEYTVIVYGNNSKVLASSDNIPMELNDRKKTTEKKISKEEISEKKRTVALLLCLFFGCFGFHRFYAKKIVSGLFMFPLCFVFIGILWWLIDLALIAIGYFEDKDKKRILKW